jgi:hypothetical protein
MDAAITWAVRISAGSFWVLLGLLGLGAYRLRKGLEKAGHDTLLEAMIAFDEAQDTKAGWGWIADWEGGGGQPLLVPDDMAERAIEVLNQETDEQKEQMAEEQWSWRVTPMGMRQAMAVAQAEPDLEMALFTWMAHQAPPVREEDDN